ncbi:MAG: HAMP domain-containing histidine kinase [Spirochaetales bacterium]|nr:HAMP domain-containing histidine kinase [Spirochaetales bacterium]
MKRQKEVVNELLLGKKDEFIGDWKAAVDEALPAFIRTKYVFGLDDFRELFDAYLADGLPVIEPGAASGVTDIIKRKINQGFPLSMIGILNAYFMATARALIRGVYPDSFDARMEYLEDLSQRVLENEIVLSQYYEDYVRDLNERLRDQTGALERRHASLLEFIDCSARELQSPLWSILGFTAKLQRTYYTILQEDGKHCLNRIAANVAEMHQLITDMNAMLLIEEETMKSESINFKDLVDATRQRVRTEVDADFEATLEGGPVVLRGEPAVLRGDRAYLSMMFYHLFKNSAQFSKPGSPGRLHVTWRASGGALHILLEDEGIGVDPRYRELVFKPLERLKEKKTDGTGMGLAFVRRIAAGHKGSVSLDDSAHGGVGVHLIFPLAMIAVME